MANNAKYLQAQPFSLAGSGCTLGATSITLSSMFQIDQTTPITMTDLGSKGYATIEPGNGTREEQISFTGIVQNTNGTATLTGVSTVLFASPYTETSGTSMSHAGAVTLILTNTSGFYSRFTSKFDDETIVGDWTFSGRSPTIPTETSADIHRAASIEYVNDIAFSGAPNATTGVKGIVQLATQAQIDAKTNTGSTGASLVGTPDLARSTLLSDYVVDTGAADAYVITPLPAISAYTAGQTFSFKAAHTNTTTSTLNVSGVGVKTLKKKDGATNLVAGDIVAGQIVVVEYDGTNFQVTNPGANTVTLTAGAYPAGDGSAITNVSTSQTLQSFTAMQNLSSKEPVVYGPFQTDGGILFDNRGTVTGATSGSFTVGANSNRIIVVFAATQTNGANITNVTYSGVSMTQVGTRLSIASGFGFYCYYLIAPATGSNTLAFSTSSGNVDAQVYSYYNVKQSGQPEANNNGTFNNTGGSNTLASIADGGLIVTAMSSNAFSTSTAKYANANATSNTSCADSGQIPVGGTTITASNTTTGGNTIGFYMISLVAFTAPTYGVFASSSATPTINQFFNLYSTFVGFTNTSATAANPVNVVIGGTVTGMSALTQAKNYYLADSVGTISITAGTNTRKVGISTSTTTLQITNIW